LFEYKLFPWIDINKLEWKSLSQNPNAIHLLREHSDKIDWSLLSLNCNAIPLLQENIEHITPTEKKNETKIYKKIKNYSFLSRWCNCTPKGFTLFHDYNILLL
jgi:hypothetical protein